MNESMRERWKNNSPDLHQAAFSNFDYTGYGSTIEGECKVGFMLTLVILLVNYLGW